VSILEIEDETLLPSKEYQIGLVPHEFRCPHTIASMRPLFCSDCTADMVYDRYMEMKRLYYIGTPVANDDNFDRYEMYAGEMFPNDVRFQTVGFHKKRKKK